MTTIAYLANEFPCAVEWYVAEEIRALRAQGFTVIPSTGKSVPFARAPESMRDLARETQCVRPKSFFQFLEIFVSCFVYARRLRDVWYRIFSEGAEPWGVRIRAIAHTFLGVCWAQQLRSRAVDHIHVHHGYYASWIAMTTARILGVPYSLTLHGSDLLVNAVYLDTKLQNCAFCLTISEFNRQFILAHFPSISSHDIIVQRIGVPVPSTTTHRDSHASPFTVLSVGRLHPVKNQSFLIQACFFLKEYGMPIRCLIAGDGPERTRLQQLIDELGLQQTVELLGHVPQEELGRYYDEADLVTLTSHSEGIPLTLMEAMARGRLVLAPSITGIPELVKHNETGFLYKPGAMEEFVWRIHQIHDNFAAYHSMRRAAHEHVRRHFHLDLNLRTLSNLFQQRAGSHCEKELYENPVLQQI